MADRHDDHAPSRPAPEHDSRAFDRELNIRSLVGFLIGLAALMAVTALAMWLMYGRLRSAEQARDPQPLPLAEARAQRVPPEPRLQSSPAQDLAAMRAEEQQTLDSYGWTDEAGGIARVPVERAMEMIVTSGLPQWPEPAPQAGTDGK